VAGPSGQPCGTIIWESKRTKNWSDGWLAKLREDQRAAKAEIAVIVSQSLPKEIEAFGLVENVWVTQTKTVLPVASRSAIRLSKSPQPAKHPRDNRRKQKWSTNT